MNPTNLTKKQLNELDSLFDLVSNRQGKDFGNILTNLFNILSSGPTRRPNIGH